MQATQEQPANTLAVRSLRTPRQMKADLPLSANLKVQIEQQRQQVRDILQGKDQRLLIVTGPCSIHDEKAAMDILAIVGRRDWNNDDNNGCTVHSAVYNLTDKTVLWVPNEHYNDASSVFTFEFH